MSDLKTKMIKHCNIIKDRDIIALLNNEFITKSDKPSNGFWSYISVEDEAGDSDGDVITISGIESDLNPEKEQYLPLLPGHKRSLPDGNAVEIGRITQLVTTTCKGMPAKAMYFEFALDENGEPIDDLVASYYKRYRLGFSSSFSVGMEALEEPEQLKTGGYRFNRTKLFEVSLVSIPANPHALAITRSIDGEEQTEETDMDKLIQTLTTHIAKLETLTSHISKLETLTSHISKLEELTASIGSLGETVKLAFKAAFEPLEQRLDILESSLVTLNTPKNIEASKKPDIKPFKDLSDSLDKLVK